MKRLVNRYIHHTKKQLRQDGVNEDDLLEIKQDISSLRYELREDRKKETVRNTGQLNNIKSDILRSFRATHLNPPGYQDVIEMNHLSVNEIEVIKREVVNAVREELREVVREIQQTVRGHPPAQLHPSMNPDLYHTHLYTQL